MNSPVWRDAEPTDTLVSLIAAVVIVVLNPESMLRRDHAATDILMHLEHDYGRRLITLNLGVRFLLEVVTIASLAYWGYRLPFATATKIAISVVAPLVLILVWAFVVAPGADNPLSQTTRMLIGSLLLLLSTAALAATGQTRPAIVVAVVIMLNTILMLAFPDTPES